MLHPVLSTLLAPTDQEPGSPMTAESFSPETARAAFMAEVAALDSQASTPPPDVPYRDLMVGVEGGEIRCRIYRPASLSDTALAPALLYLHGGGWIYGGIESHDAICRFLAHHTPCIVIAPEYRLAPEHRFPTPLNDAFATYQWIIENSANEGIDRQRIAIAGDSAGANMAFGISSLSLKEAIVTPCFQLLLYPVCNLFAITQSREEFRQGYWLDNIDFQTDCYIRSDADRLDPLASISLTRDLSEMPPTRIVTAGFDPLRDEGIALAQKLSAQNVPTELVNYPSYIHGFMSLRGLLPEVDDILRETSAVISRGLMSAD